jgi:cellulose synthase operon protein YhjQ
MDSRSKDKIEEPAVAETPEDVAVLYSWANLHGVKYRDFSASRREYRAQLRHRAAEQVREQALLAQAEAEAAARAADEAARQATEAARKRQPEESDSSVQRSWREADEAARTAAAERVEAARRAEAAAVAEVAARREEREIAEAHAAALRQAARYADSEMRRRAIAGSQPDSAELPGQVTDPYTMQSMVHPPASSAVLPQLRTEPAHPMQPNKPLQDFVLSSTGRGDDKQTGQTFAPQQAAPRRPQGYRPDDASGVRQIYRGPDYDASAVEYTAGEPGRRSAHAQSRSAPVSQELQEIKQDMKPTNDQYAPSPHPSPNASSREGQAAPVGQTGQRRTDLPLGPAPASAIRSVHAEAASPANPEGPLAWTVSAGDRPDAASPRQGFGRDAGVHPAAYNTPAARPLVNARPAATPSAEARPVTPFSQALVPPDATRGRRVQDDFDYQQSQGTPVNSRRSVPEPPPEPVPVSAQRPAYASDTAGPAWLYAPPTPQVPQRLVASPPVAPQSSVADTLQHSRERVAARWFALKGVFEQPGQEQESVPVRQKETRTPVLAVFSLAGGVGKTSLIATVGRSLSSMGEKVLLTDTTSHGLLPFYFGASELRQGTVRTFSPPSGSTDAPIYLVSYDIDQKATDDEGQELLAGEIINNSRGTHRILLDLTVSSSWIVRHMSRMNPTILVPVAPDMNSVISLQTVEKFFSGVNDGDGRALQPYYVLNQFDTSLPLHLDVREVMRRQLGDRLLPFVIRRAPAVSEALAEGMTVVDYAPDAPIAEDYLNLATWLRTVAAPATAGFRNVRWSER